MKKLAFLLGLTAGVLLFSCKKDEPIEETTSNKTGTIYDLLGEWWIDSVYLHDVEDDIDTFITRSNSGSYEFLESNIHYLKDTSGSYSTSITYWEINDDSVYCRHPVFGYLQTHIISTYDGNSAILTYSDPESSWIYGSYTKEMKIFLTKL